MRVRVVHSIDRLAQQQAQRPVRLAAEAPRIVKDNADFGRDLARALARERAGRHGSAYWKRINSEMTGSLEAEFGPDGTPKSEFVGVGFRHGRNTDLPKAADKAAAALAADVRKLLSRLSG